MLIILSTADTRTARVSVEPDRWTYITVGATVIAVLLALFSIWYAAQQAAKARTDAEKSAEQGRKDAALDRRLQYELSVLAEMARQHGITGVQHLSGYVRSLIGLDSPDDDLPLLRVLSDIHPSAPGRTKDAEIVRAAKAGVDPNSYSVQQEVDNQRIHLVGTEIAEAITRRLRH